MIKMDTRQKVKWILSPIWIPFFVMFCIGYAIIMLMTLPMALCVWIRREPLEPESFWECWINF